jgi:hypothetical protein
MGEGHPADDFAGAGRGRRFEKNHNRGEPMASMNENERMEYSVLMSRGRDAERTSRFCWMAAGIAATMFLSWGMAAKNPALMLPVIFAMAFGFYTMVHSRHQTRLIGGYLKEFCECDGGPQWFTRLGHLEIVPGFSASSSDWLSTMLANAVVVAAVAFAWMYSSPMPKGELFAGIVTGCGIAFMFHSFTETTKLRQSDAAGFWRQIGMGPTEERRPQRMVGR